MTLLSICQQVADESGVTRPSYIIGNNDLTARRLLAAAKSAGRELAEGRIRAANGNVITVHDWSALRKEQTFTTTASDYDYVLDSTGIITDNDFQRIVKDTIWDRTNNRWIRFVEPVEWQNYVSGLITIGIDKIATIRGGQLLIHTTPTSTDTYAFEYISKHWCESSGGTGQTTWAADTDVGVLPDDLLELGTRWRFKEMMGLPYAEDKLDYLEAVMVAQGHDIPTGTVNMAEPRMIFTGNIPDTGYGA
jgi:hypothetical protein